MRQQFYYDTFTGASASPISGGIVDDVNIEGTDYRLHIFNTSGSFYTESDISNVEYLVVAGGGYNGQSQRGAGAGGVRYTFGSPATLIAGTYNIKVGQVGIPESNPGASTVGDTSSFNGLTSTGGGGGGSSVFNNGGSGAGGYYYVNGELETIEVGPGTGIAGQGHNGGDGWWDGGTVSLVYTAGGGGGAGQAGGSSDEYNGGSGGDGVDLSTYVTTGYGQNGYFGGGREGKGGISGGNGLGIGTNTGGGGYSGVVIIRYPI